MSLGCVWGCILVREMFCFCFPCSRWVNTGAMFFFCFFSPSAVEWRQLFGNVPRISVLLHEMQTQRGLLRTFRGFEVTTHRIPNLISNMCAYDFCSLIACSSFARFFCSMQLLYMSIQFGRFHAMLKMGSAGAGKGIAIKVWQMDV